MRWGVIVGISTVVLIVAGLFAYAMYSQNRISAAEARRRIANKEVNVVLDVRTTVERNTLGFYPGSTHIPAADVEMVVPQRYPDRNTRIIVYCNTGQRARAAADKLHALGYTQATYIAGPHTSLL